VVDVPLPQESVLKDPVVVVEGLVRRTKQVGGWLSLHFAITIILMIIVIIFYYIYLIITLFC
jgi:hypothetical protein